MSFVNMFDTRYKAEHFTPPSETNVELKANRPADGTYKPGQVNYNKGALFQRGGGKFLSRGDMARIKRQAVRLAAQAKRNGTVPRPLNDGDSYVE